MRDLWRALREHLQETITTHHAYEQWDAARNRDPHLLVHRHPESLVGWFRDTDGDRDDKDYVYRILVRAVQQREACFELARALIWLGLWPGLDATYRSRARDRRADLDELASEIVWLLTKQIERMELARVRRLAATLVLNVRRDLSVGLARSQRDRDRTEDWADYEELFDDERPGIDDRQLPVDATDEGALHRWLTGIVGDDASLVVGASLYEIDQRELAERLGITHEAARKRFQRAIQKVRRHLEK